MYKLSAVTNLTFKEAQILSTIVKCGNTFYTKIDCQTISSNGGLVEFRFLKVIDADMEYLVSIKFYETGLVAILNKRLSTRQVLSIAVEHYEHADNLRKIILNSKVYLKEAIPLIKLVDRLEPELEDIEVFDKELLEAFAMVKSHFSDTNSRLTHGVLVRFLFSIAKEYRENFL